LPPENLPAKLSRDSALLARFFRALSPLHLARKILGPSLPPQSLNIDFLSSQAEEIPFKTPVARGNAKKVSAKAAAAAAAKEEKPKEEEPAQNQLEFKAPANRKNTFKRGTAKAKASPKPAAESHDDAMEVESKTEKIGACI
jgi:hypothetical protein